MATFGGRGAFIRSYLNHVRPSHKVHTISSSFCKASSSGALGHHHPLDNLPAVWSHRFHRGKFVNWPNQERWMHLWQSIGACGDGGHWYEALTQAYAESQRHYHTQQHIAECLAEFDEARHLAKEPRAIELALWFHDAVYDPKAGDNEERSAAIAKQCLSDAGLPELATTVAALVMVTKSHESGSGSDAPLMKDVDLSILGQNPERFAEYETQIREEYSFVPNVLFNFKRAQILQRFLDRPRIYSTDHFNGKYEKAARRNLADSIRKLRRWW
jgi:predicted metal-dependent HD superfamily phosphohydrolase